jgi:hypothetical protein
MAAEWSNIHDRDQGRVGPLHASFAPNDHPRVRDAGPMSADVARTTPRAPVASRWVSTQTDLTPRTRSRTAGGIDASVLVSLT